MNQGKPTSRNLPAARQSRREFRALLLPFAGNGFQAGVYTVLVADLAGALRLGPGALGVALATLAAAAIPSVAVAGRIADRSGRRVVLVSGAAAAGLFFLLLAVVGSYPALLGAMVLGGLAFGFFDMSPDSLGGDFERQYGENVMNRLHVGHNGAATLGSFLSGVALWAGLGYRWIYVVVGMLLLILALVSLRLPLPARLPEPVKSNQEPGRWSMASWLAGGVVLAVVLVGFEALTGAALEGYSSIYLRDVLVSSPLVAGMGIAAYQLARLLGQAGSAATIDTIGERGVLAIAGAGVAVGIVTLVVTGSPIVGATGLLLVGLFSAPVRPISASIAGRAAPGRVGHAMAAVWGAFYVSSLAGPLLVGALADAFTLRVALSVFIPTSLLIAALAWWKVR